MAICEFENDGGCNLYKDKPCIANGCRIFKLYRDLNYRDISLKDLKDSLKEKNQIILFLIRLFINSENGKLYTQNFDAFNKSSVVEISDSDSKYYIPISSSADNLSKLLFDLEQINSLPDSSVMFNFKNYMAQLGFDLSD